MKGINTSSSFYCTVPQAHMMSLCGGPTESCKGLKGQSTYGTLESICVHVCGMGLCLFSSSFFCTLAVGFKDFGFCKELGDFESLISVQGA